MNVKPSHHALVVGIAASLIALAGCSSPPPPVEPPPPPSDPLHASPTLAGWRSAHSDLFRAIDLGPRSERKSLYLWAERDELRERLIDIGSLTDAHFAALGEIVAEATEVNAGILSIISRGGFEPERVETLVKEADAGIRDELAAELRRFVGERAMTMVRDGIDKAAALDAESAGALVVAVEPGENKDEIATSVLAELEPRTVEDAVAAVADAPSRAKILAGWFGAKAQRAIATAENLEKLASAYEGPERLQILGAHVANVRGLDAVKLLDLINMVPEQSRWTLFEEGVKTIPEVEAMQLHALARAMGDQKTSAAVLFGVRQVNKPSLADAKTLLAIMEDAEAQSRVAVVLAQRIDALDSQGLISLAEGLKERPRDDALAAGMRRLYDISVDDAIEVIHSAHARQRGLAVIAAKTLRELDLDGLLELADQVEHDGKDAVLWAGIRRVRPPPDAEGVKRVHQTAYNRRRSLVIEAIDRTPRLTAIELATITDEFHGPDRDAVLLAGLKKVDRLTPKQLAKLTETAHAQNEEIAKAGLRRVFGLNVDALATVVKPLPTDPHDNVLRFGVRYLQNLHESDVPKLVALAKKDKAGVEDTAKQLLAEARLKRRERLARDQERARLEQAEQLNPDVPDDENR